MNQPEIDIVNAYMKNLSERVQSLTVEAIYSKSRIEVLEKELLEMRSSIDEYRAIIDGTHPDITGEETDSAKSEYSAPAPKKVAKRKRS